MSQRVAFLNSNNDGSVKTKPSLKIFIERFEEEMLNSEVAYRQDAYLPSFINKTTYGAIHEVSVPVETSMNGIEAANFRGVRDNLNSEASSKYQVKGNFGAQLTVGTETHSRYETFESFRYTNNQLISFYPKQIQKVLARRHKTNNPTSERLAQQIRVPNPKKAIKHAKKM